MKKQENVGWDPLWWVLGTKPRTRLLSIKISQWLLLFDWDWASEWCLGCWAKSRDKGRKRAGSTACWCGQGSYSQHLIFRTIFSISFVPAVKRWALPCSESAFFPDTPRYSQVFPLKLHPSRKVQGQTSKLLLSQFYLPPWGAWRGGLKDQGPFWVWWYIL